MSAPTAYAESRAWHQFVAEQRAGELETPIFPKPTVLGIAAVVVLAGPVFVAVSLWQAVTR